MQHLFERFFWRWARRRRSRLGLHPRGALAKDVSERPHALSLRSRPRGGEDRRQQDERQPADDGHCDERGNPILRLWLAADSARWAPQSKA